MNPTPVQAFSPTQTDAYAFCPRYWGFYRQGLKPRCIEYPEIASIIGTAVMRGLETFYLLRRDAEPVGPADIEQIATTYAVRLREAALVGGKRYVSSAAQPEWDMIDQHVSTCLKTHAKRDPFLAYEVVDVESEDVNGGRSDLVLKDDYGLLIVDFKCKLKLRAEWIPKEMTKWRRSWQMHHYTITRGAGRFAVALIAPHTRQGVHVEITQVQQGYVGLWYQDAVQLWGEMVQRQAHLPQQLRGNTSHANEYGECAYWSEACSHGMDPALTNLVQVERVK